MPLVDHQHGLSALHALNGEMNFAWLAMNSLLFPCVLHAQGCSHEWHSFSRLNRFYRFCGPLALAWLCQEPLMKWISEWMKTTSAPLNKSRTGALRVGFVPLVDCAPLIAVTRTDRNDHAANPYESQTIKEPFSVAT